MMAIAMGSGPATIADEALTLEEIVVTAQRREQSLQDVPISVSAFSSEALKKGNISEARDYLSITPNVGFSDDGGSGSRSVNISIRGVSNVGLGEVSTANSIGFYIDELNVGSVSNGTINPQLQDMERIEVLRGPQGTYFGRNSLGGALNISTKLPDSEFYAEASVKASNFDTYGGEAIVNLPISETFMMRAVYAYEESDGFVENVNPAGAEDGYEHHSGRVAFRWLPSDKTSVDLSLTYTDEDEGGDITVPTGVLNQDTQSIFGAGFVAINEAGFYSSNDDKVNRDLKEINTNEFTIVNLRIAHDFDGFQFKSITGVVESETDRSADLDGMSLDTLRRFNEYEGSSFSQEFRIQSTGDQTIDWTLGVFYAKDEIEQFNSVQAGDDGEYTDPNTGEVIGLLPPIPGGFRINENNRVFETESQAVFGEAVYHLNDQWDLTLGARYTRDEIDNRSFDVVAFEGAVPDSQGDSSFTNFSPKVVLKYAPTREFNVYGSVSQGYKAGGVDFTRSGDITDFDPEELTSYELGFKSELAGGRVRVAGALFYLDWTDLQVQSNFLADPNDISSAVEKTLNAAEASASGAELEVTARVTESLTASFSMGYLDSEFDSFENALIKGNSTEVDLSGERLPMTPELTMSASLDYAFTMGEYEGFIRGEWNYRDEAASNLEAVASTAGVLELPKFPYQIDDYNVVNIRAGLESERIRLSAYVENVFGEDYYTGTGDGFGLVGIKVKPHPRVYGMQLTYMFD
jgi:iron complex outermembrane receptor protein